MKYSLRLLAVIALLVSVGALAQVPDQVITCDAPSSTCALKWVPATTETLTFNTAGGTSCWINNAGCAFRKLAVMAPTDKVFSRIGSDSTTEAWRNRSEIVLPGASVPPVMGTRIATVSWAAPTVYTDGSPITETLKFNVYRGASATALSLVRAGAVSPFVDSGLAPGTYFYTITALNAKAESDKPPAQSFTITPPTLIPGPPTSISISLSVTFP